MAELEKNYVPVCADNPAIEKDQNLCANCGHCLAVCREEIGVAGWREPTGNHAASDDSGAAGQKAASQWKASGQFGMAGHGLGHGCADVREPFACIHCGQCAAACPEGALRGKSHWREVKEAVDDPERIVIVSTSPSVRVGLGDCFLKEKGSFVEGQMVSALRNLGADYVLDVAFSADLTIMEEGTELLGRLMSRKGPLPQFTSCCPAWVKYVETFHPERISNLSSAKSPISMQGALIKTYFAQEMGIDPRRIVSVAVAPCTAKKFEITRKELCSAGTYLGIPDIRDNDYVLTTRELAEWIQWENLEFAALPLSEFDRLMGKSSGAGLIFGNSGGVMEAALRMAYSVLTGMEPGDLLLDYQPVRGLSSIKEAEVVIGEHTVRTAVIYGTAEAERMIRTGIMDQYDFVEVMTCPGGCISGAGQPGNGVVPVPDDLRSARIKSLYQADRKRSIRSSLDNGEIQKLYEMFLEEPLGETAEQLLHTQYRSRRLRTSH